MILTSSLTLTLIFGYFVLYLWKIFHTKSVTGHNLWVAVGSFLFRHKCNFFSYLENFWPEIPVLHFQWDFINFNVIVINDVKVARNTLSHPLMNARTSNPVWLGISHGKYGLVNTMGEVHKEQNRFNLHTFKEIGLWSSRMESLVQIQARRLVETLKATKGRVISPNVMLESYIGIPVWTIVAGEEFVTKYQDELCQLFRVGNRVWKILLEFPAVAFLFFNQLPVSHTRLRQIVKFFPGLQSLRIWFDFNYSALQFSHKIIEENEKSSSFPLKEGEDPSNFVQAYLDKVAKTEDEGSCYYQQKGRNHLIGFLGDLIYAATVTQSRTIGRGILHLVRNPRIQQKIQEELDRVVGRERRPVLSDRPNELLREATPFVTGLPHVSAEDTTIGSMEVKKGSIIFLNLIAMHRNKELWGDDPSTFRPERFLDNKGKFCKSDSVVPFYVGSRACPFYQTALDNIFQFLTAICQNFQVCQNPNESRLPSLDRENSVLSSSKLFYVQFRER